MSFVSDFVFVFDGKMRKFFVPLYYNNGGGYAVRLVNECSVYKCIASISVFWSCRWNESINERRRTNGNLQNSYLPNKYKPKKKKVIKEELIVPRLSNGIHDVKDQQEHKLELKPTIYDRERSEESVVPSQTKAKKTLIPKQLVKDLTMVPITNQSL